MVQGIISKYKTTVLSDKDLEGNTALHLAAARGYSDVISVLLDDGADIEAR